MTAWAVIARKSTHSGRRSGLFTLWFCGRAPYGSVLTMLLSYQCSPNREGRVIRIREVVGGLAFGLSVTGLTHAAATGTRSDRGGLISARQSRLSRALAGTTPPESGFSCIGSAAVLIATNSNPLLLYRRTERESVITGRCRRSRTRMSSIRSRPWRRSRPNRSIPERKHSPLRY